MPELTGEQVREMLAPVFDFKALTEAEAYEKTLPPKVQDAIKNHQILVGMDREMVIYAKGRPPKKIRDKDDTGADYEEWIYGDPPQEVEFVRFTGAFVTRLEIMTVDGEKVVRTEKRSRPALRRRPRLRTRSRRPSRPTLPPCDGRASNQKIRVHRVGRLHSRRHIRRRPIQSKRNARGSHASAAIAIWRLAKQT